MSNKNETVYHLRADGAPVSIFKFGMAENLKFPTNEHFTIMASTGVMEPSAIQVPNKSWTVFVESSKSYFIQNNLAYQLVPVSLLS